MWVITCGPAKARAVYRPRNNAAAIGNLEDTHGTSAETNEQSDMIATEGLDADVTAIDAVASSDVQAPDGQVANEPSTNTSEAENITAIDTE